MSFIARTSSHKSLKAEVFARSDNRDKIFQDYVRVLDLQIKSRFDPLEVVVLKKRRRKARQRVSFQFHGKGYD